MQASHFSIIVISILITSLFTTGAFAQNDSTFKYDPTLQYGSKPPTPAETPEQLHKKLANARDAISNTMGSKMGDIPFNEVGIDEVNSTLDVGIDSSKATLSEEQYLKKIKEIVGDVPIKITFGQITSLPLILANNSVRDNNTSASIPSPLNQFKSGIAVKNVKCKEGLQIIIKNENGQPACVTPYTFDELRVRGWGIMLLDKIYTYNNPDFYISISYNGTQLSNDKAFYVKQGQNVTLMLDVISDPANMPVTLYTAPHSGFTKTNGIDFKLSDTMVNTPTKVMLYMSVSRDATPSTYGGTVKGNSTYYGSATYLFFVTVK